MEGQDSPALRLFMWVVTALAAPLVALTAWQAAAHLDGLDAHLVIVIALFSLVLVAGELWPIPVARGEEGGDEITVSSTFGFALLLVVPVFFTVLAQTIALALDWKLHGRQWHRLPFNVAQYALAFAAARGAYALAAQEPFTGIADGPPDLFGAVVAGATFLLLNNGLVAVAVASHLQVPVWKVLAEDVTWQLMTSAPLLGLGPLAAQAAQWTPASVVLLLIPIVALHRSGHTAMKREQEALRDPLTGLANRTLLASAAERALQSATGTTAMLLIDLDHFKDVNDTLGHAVGDELLIAVSQRLQAEAGPGDLVARLGGDEFVVLARRCAGPQEAEDLARRLGEAISQPYRVQGVVLTVGCSVGIGLAPDHVGDVEGLLRCADVALYAAKDTRGTHALYDRHTDQHSAALLGLQADLRAALEDPEDQQISVVYQPQLDLHTGRVSAVECLVRWRHPELGNLLPDNFIPMAESTSLIDSLMRRVLHLALAQLAAWSREGLDLSLAVNLSARQLSDLTLPTTVLDVLQQHDVSPDRLLLEVTESRLMSDPERSVQILSRLQALGVSLSIDDFGTGYSSLAYLQRLAVDELKIDKSFILGLGEPGNAAIVRSTIELGHNLGLRIVAEGVEDQASADALAGMGCDMLQGYFLGRPTVAADLRAVLLAAPLVNPRPRAPARCPHRGWCRPPCCRPPPDAPPPVPPTEPGDPCVHGLRLRPARAQRPPRARPPLPAGRAGGPALGPGRPGPRAAGAHDDRAGRPPARGAHRGPPAVVRGGGGGALGQPPAARPAAHRPRRRHQRRGHLAQRRDAPRAAGGPRRGGLPRRPDGVQEQRRRGRPGAGLAGRHRGHPGLAALPQRHQHRRRRRARRRGRAAARHLPQPGLAGARAPRRPRAPRHLSGLRRAAPPGPARGPRAGPRRSRCRRTAGRGRPAPPAATRRRTRASSAPGAR